MRFIPALALAATVLLSGAGVVSAQENLESLRGKAPINQEVRTDNMFRPEKDKCMDCHSKERAEETGATLVAKSHYLDREDKKHANISPRRYFCMQCHVPQFDAKPLVENTYIPAAK